MMSESTGRVTVEEPRPKYAWVFDVAIAGAIGLAIAAALFNQHRIHERLTELVESTNTTRAEAMLGLERDIDHYNVPAGDGSDDE
jgi:hypothetical protein